MAGAEPLAPAELSPRAIDFPRKDDFLIEEGSTYLNAAYTHPIPKVSKEAAVRAAGERCGVRPPVGYYEAARLDAVYPPNIPAGPYAPVRYELERSAAGMFETGSLHGSPGVAIALLSASLGYIKELGVANIQAHRQPMIRKLQQEVPRLGFLPVTPAQSTGATSRS